ncbi:MAG: arginine repressor [candidate division WOR-3 bacterium]
MRRSLREKKRRLRQEKIKGLLSSREIRTQEELLKEIAGLGITVTQATLSRDLREMGVVKVPTGLGKYIYKITTVETSASERELKDKFIKFVQDIKIAGNLIIVKTPPGEAQGVARVIDLAKIKGILGSVAGDDTILLVINNRSNARQILSFFRGLSGQG